MTRLDYALGGRGKMHVVSPSTQLPLYAQDKVAAKCMVHGSYKNWYAFGRSNYISHADSALDMGFCHFAHVVGFDELDPGEAVDVEELEPTEVLGTEVVVDIRTMVAGIRQQKCRDKDSMA